MADAIFAHIKQYITDNIETKLWLEHTKVPSENQLASQFRCCRMTARRALTELVNQGILVRSQGLGTFVSSIKSQSSLVNIRNIADEIKQRGKTYRAALYALDEIDALAPIAIALGLELGSRVYYSQLVHYEQDTPLQLEERFVNPQLASGYLQQDFSQITPHEYLAQITPLTEARHIIEAISSTVSIKEKLALKNDEPCLQILKRTWNRQGIVSFARLVHPGNRFRLGGQLTF